MPVLWLQRGHFCTFAGLDPNRDPNAETTGQYWADTVDVPLNRKHAKAPESVAAQRFPALIVSSHAGGHWFESSSLHQKVPDFVRNQELFLFMSSNSNAAFWRSSHDPNRDPKAERSGKHRRGADGIIRPSRTIFVGYMVWLMTLPMAFRIFSWVCRKESGSNMVPVLGDTNR